MGGGAASITSSISRSALLRGSLVVFRRVMERRLTLQLVSPRLFRVPEVYKVWDTSQTSGMPKNSSFWAFISLEHGLSKINGLRAQLRVGFWASKLRTSSGLGLARSIRGPGMEPSEKIQRSQTILIAQRGSNTNEKFLGSLHSISARWHSRRIPSLAVPQH